MVRKIKVKLILELRDAHMSKTSVSKVFNIADKKCIHYDDVKDLSDNDAMMTNNYTLL